MFADLQNRINLLLTEYPVHLMWDCGWTKIQGSLRPRIFVNLLMARVVLTNYSTPRPFIDVIIELRQSKEHPDATDVANSLLQCPAYALTLCSDLAAYNLKGIR